MLHVDKRENLPRLLLPQALRAAEFWRNLFWGYRRIRKPVWGDGMDFAHLSDGLVTGSLPLARPPFWTTANTFKGAEAIRYQFNNWCYVEFFDFREAAGGAAIVTPGPATVISKHTVGAGRDHLDNGSDTEAVLSLTFTRESEDESVKELAVTASTEFRQLIKAGGEAASFSSETEITAKLEAMAKDTSRTLTRVGLTKEYSQPIPGRTRRYVEWLIEMGRYRQPFTVDGPMDYSMRLWCHGDFTYTWLDGKEWVDCINGVGDRARAARDGRDNFADGFAHQLPKLVGAMPDGIIDSIMQPMRGHLELVREFDRAYDQTTTVRDEPLTGKD